jgi:hypothetical protein
MDLAGLFPLAGLSAGFAAVIVSAVDFIKRVVTAHVKWTIPDYAWYALAVLIPVAICWATAWNDFASLTGQGLPQHLQSLGPPATGAVIGVGASGSYKAKQLVKATGAAMVAKLKLPMPPKYVPKQTSGGDKA